MGTVRAGAEQRKQAMRRIGPAHDMPAGRGRSRGAATDMESQAEQQYGQAVFGLLDVLTEKFGPVFAQMVLQWLLSREHQPEEGADAVAWAKSALAEGKDELRDLYSQSFDAFFDEAVQR